MESKVSRRIFTNSLEFQPEKPKRLQHFVRPRSCETLVLGQQELSRQASGVKQPAVASDEMSESTNNLL